MNSDVDFYIDWATFKLSVLFSVELSPFRFFDNDINMFHVCKFELSDVGGLRSL